jgi:CHAT domain-containing protein
LSSGEPFDVVHFTTHGAHNFDYMEGAGIRCADGGLLTARWVFENTRLTNFPLVCLAACQTGLADFSNLPHETFGLPTAFLSAGAGAVISSQWPIDDVATRLIMTRVYQNLKLGNCVATALCEAQLWLRDADESSLGAASTGAKRFITLDADGDDTENPPFSHPYFWSGFLLHRA